MAKDAAGLEKRWRKHQPKWAKFLSELIPPVDVVNEIRSAASRDDRLAPDLGAACRYSEKFAAITAELLTYFTNWGEDHTQNGDRFWGDHVLERFDDVRRLLPARPVLLDPLLIELRAVSGPQTRWRCGSAHEAAVEFGQEVARQVCLSAELSRRRRMKTPARDLPNDRDFWMTADLEPLRLDLRSAYEALDKSGWPSGGVRVGDVQAEAARAHLLRVTRANPVYVSEAVGALSVSPPTEPDGPLPPHRFRYRGKTVSFGRAALRYRLVVALWDASEHRPREFRPMGKVIEEVYGGQRSRKPEERLHALCSEVRKAFRTEGLALTVRTEGAMIWLEPSAS